MVKIGKLAIEGSWIIQSPVHTDERGYFREWFHEESIKKSIGRTFPVAQSNFSKSHKGVIRGIHFSTSPHGQAKWITCANGAIWDVVVDINPGSPTFMRWDAVELRAGDGTSVLISEGLGHAFIALEDESIISYLLTTQYAPEHEFAINPLDQEIAIKWPINPIHLSSKDRKAPSLRNYLKNKI